MSIVTPCSSHSRVGITHGSSRHTIEQPNTEATWHFKQDWLCRIPHLDLPPGNLIGAYRVTELIRQSNMGFVLKAEQINLNNRQIVIKLMRPDLAGNRYMRLRFKKEVEITALLNNPAFVTVYDANLEVPIPYFAMEYVNGIDLWQLVHESGALPLRQAMSLIRQVVMGLQYVFERGLVHRDIKPSNLMLVESPFDPNWAVKIIDWGVGDWDDPCDCRFSHDLNDLTQAGMFLGTPSFIAPEQAIDPRTADIRADIYSTGATLSFLLTGQVANHQPIKATSETCGDPPNPVETVAGAEIPSEVSALIGRMLSPAPHDRPQTPTELLEELTRVLPAYQ